MANQKIQHKKAIFSSTNLHGSSNYVTTPSIWRQHVNTLLPALSNSSSLGKRCTKAVRLTNCLLTMSSTQANSTHNTKWRICKQTAQRY